MVLDFAVCIPQAPVLTLHPCSTPHPEHTPYLLWGQEAEVDEFAVIGHQGHHLEGQKGLLALVLPQKGVTECPLTRWSCLHR